MIQGKDVAPDIPVALTGVVARTALLARLKWAGGPPIFSRTQPPRRLHALRRPHLPLAIALVAAISITTVQAELFDGITGDELPPVTACWGVCPPVAGEDFADCRVYTHLNPFQCVVVPLYHADDPDPDATLPGGPGFWSPHAGDNPCPAPWGQSVRLIVHDARHYKIDSGCWVPD